MPDPINCPPGEEYAHVERRNRSSDRRAPSYCPESCRIDDIYQRVERMTGLISQYQVLDVRVGALERAVTEIENGIKTTSDDIHQIQLIISHNSQISTWIERGAIAVFAWGITEVAPYIMQRLV